MTDKSVTKKEHPQEKYIPNMVAIPTSPKKVRVNELAPLSFFKYNGRLYMKYKKPGPGVGAIHVTNDKHRGHVLDFERELVIPIESKITLMYTPNEVTRRDVEYER